MNKRGFTLLELLTSLTLTSVVCILLFQVVFVLKDIYINDSTKTEMLIKKSNIIDEINSTFKKYPITAIRDCDVKEINCLNFILEGDLNYELSLNREEGMIKFGDFVTQLAESANIYDDLDVCYYYETNDSNLIYDTFVKIRIPLQDNILEEKFDANIIYQYNGDSFPNLIGTINDGIATTYVPHC